MAALPEELPIEMPFADNSRADKHGSATNGSATNANATNASATNASATNASATNAKATNASANAVYSWPTNVLKVSWNVSTQPTQVTVRINRRQPT